MCPMSLERDKNAPEENWTLGRRLFYRRVCQQRGLRSKTSAKIKSAIVEIALPSSPFFGQTAVTVNDIISALVLTRYARHHKSGRDEFQQRRLDRPHLPARAEPQRGHMFWTDYRRRWPLQHLHDAEAPAESNAQHPVPDSLGHPRRQRTLVHRRGRSSGTLEVSVVGFVN